MSEKLTYSIDICGCDDTTSFEMDLTKEEAALIERLKNLSLSTSTYSCQPTLEVELKKEPEEEKKDCWPLIGER